MSLTEFTALEAATRDPAGPPRPPGGRRYVFAVFQNEWVGFLARRIVGMIGVLIALAVVTFALVRLIPGDPASIVAGINSTPAELRIIRHQLGLDQSIWAQFGNFWVRLFHYDLGTSFNLSQPVTTIIDQRVTSSLELAAAALVLVLGISIPAGLFAGALGRDNKHRKSDLAFTSVTSIFGSIPEYLTGTFLAFIFAVVLKWLPVAGSTGFASLVLPALAIALRPMSILARLVRAETLNVFATDYMRTARSKRLPARLVYLRHALPNVVTAALSIAGILFASIIGGAVVVENVFARAGIGTALVNAVLNRDYPLIQGLILVLGVIVVVVNALVDVLIAIVDPRSMNRKV